MFETNLKNTSGHDENCLYRQSQSLQTHSVPCGRKREQWTPADKQHEWKRIQINSKYNIVLHIIIYTQSMYVVHKMDRHMTTVPTTSVCCWFYFSALCVEKRFSRKFSHFSS